MSTSDGSEGHREEIVEWNRGGKIVEGKKKRKAEEEGRGMKQHD